jgi:hypothetical protein
MTPLEALAIVENEIAGQFRNEIEVIRRALKQHTSALDAVADDCTMRLRKAKEDMEHPWL